MITENQTQSPREWAIEHFGGAELSHVKRVDRTITIAEAMAASPGKSLSEMFAHRYDLTAAYTFFRQPEVTPDNLQAGHRELVLCEMEKPGRYLMIADTSEVLCTKTGEIIGLGPVGASKDKQIGFHLHSVLVVRWPSEPNQTPPRRPTVEILGLADQQYHVRQPRSEKNKAHASLRRSLPAEELESSLWEKASRRVGPAPDREDVVWIKVGDRGADIFDHLSECKKQGHRFIVRARQDRVLLTVDGKRAGKLFETVRATASCGELELELRFRPGQAARRARLQVSFTPLILRAPQVAGQGPGEREPVACMVVRLWEPDPPAGAKALEWILLTDLEVTNFEQDRGLADVRGSLVWKKNFIKRSKPGWTPKASIGNGGSLVRHRGDEKCRRIALDRFSRTNPFDTSSPGRIFGIEST